MKLGPKRKLVQHLHGHLNKRRKYCWYKVEAPDFHLDGCFAYQTTSEHGLFHDDFHFQPWTGVVFVNFLADTVWVTLELGASGQT